MSDAEREVRRRQADQLLALWLIITGSYTSARLMVADPETFLNAVTIERATGRQLSKEEARVAFQQYKAESERYRAERTEAYKARLKVWVETGEWPPDPEIEAALEKAGR